MGRKRIYADDEARREAQRVAARARYSAKRPRPLTDEELEQHRIDSYRRTNAIHSRPHEHLLIAETKHEGHGLDLTAGDLRTYFNLGSGCRQMRPARRCS